MYRVTHVWWPLLNWLKDREMEGAELMVIYSILKAKQRKDLRACILRNKKNIQGKNYYGFSPAPFTPRYLKGELWKCKHRLSDVLGKRWRTLLTNSVAEPEL